MTTPAQIERHAEHHALLANLTHELFQTEYSARIHPMREARRLGDIPPAKALRAVAEHAGRCWGPLHELARHERLPGGLRGSLTGRLFSSARHFLMDRLIDDERSYRGTLIGFRHGLDLVKLFRMCADASGRVEIGGFCTRWLQEREPLVAAVEHGLTWFALHPIQARHRPPVARRFVTLPAHAAH